MYSFDLFHRIQCVLKIISVVVCADVSDIDV
jgi:hypothetical protein